MQIPLSWLRDYVEIDMGADELADALTMAGLESVNQGSSVPDIEGVITARIEKIEPHPQADKLTVCRVRSARGEDPHTIVCGAPNISEGDIVPLALVGTTLPDGTKLKKAKIRGVESRGMMCSQRELGISDDHSGIWILPPNTPIGKRLPEALGAEDSIIESDPTPNRGDLLSVVGVAREIAAVTGGAFTPPRFEVKEEGPPIEELARVDIENYDGCPRYAARLVQGLTIGPSPEWMVKKLEAAGMRAINNVVDVTNFVMLELGQPLHAFDFNRLRGRRIVVKNARAGDRFTTLDDQERVLRDDTLMICDGEGPVAVAGVMGGLDSEVGEDTKDVLIESACFKPSSIRRTARLLSMPTEASRRFDKGVDPMGTVTAADRAAALMQELAGGKICKGVIDAREKEMERNRIVLRPDRTNRILGTSLDREEQAEILSRLPGMEVSMEGDNIVALAPGYRPDLAYEYDLIEEVARLKGYHTIDATMPSFRMEPMRAMPELKLASKVRERLAALGFSEVINTNFEDPTRLGALGLKKGDPRMKAVKVANPLSENESILRTTLLPKLLSTFVMNRSRGAVDPIRLFELNAAFEQGAEELPFQRTMLAALASGPAEKFLWDLGCKVDGFYDIKGVAEEVIDAVGFPGARIEPADDPESFLHPGKSARLMVGSSAGGWLGELHPRVAVLFEIGEPLFIFEFQFDMLSGHGGHVPKTRPISKFPPTLRDIAVVVDESVTMGDIIKAANKLKSPTLESMILFDVFRGGSIAAGKKSMAFHVRYQSLDRTLTDDEINREHQRLAEQLRRAVGAALR